MEPERSGAFQPSSFHGGLGAAAPTRGVLELGRSSFDSWQRVWHWSAASMAASLVLLLGATALGQDSPAASAMLAFGVLGLLGGAVGALLAIRSGRMVRVHRQGRVTVVRLLVPSLEMTGMTHVVVHEEAWQHRSMRTGTSAADGSLASPMDTATGSGLASIYAAFSDGHEVGLLDADWAQRDAVAASLADFTGTTVVTRRTSRDASCG